MKEQTVQEFRLALKRRGFADDGQAPNRTITLTQEFLIEKDLLELYDMLVTRREKVFRSTGVVGAEASRQAFDDVVIAIEALQEAVRLSFGEL